MTPVIDVLILTWNDGELANEAVTSALASDAISANVFVLDNASDTPFIFQDERVKVIRSDRNLGVGPGRQRLFHESSAEFFCFLDSDARLQSDTLKTMLAALTSSEDVAAVGPVFVGQPPEVSAGFRPRLLDKLNRILGSTTYRHPYQVGSSGYFEVDFIIGACQLIRRDRFIAIGGVDTSIAYGPEDVDMCLKLRLQGGKVLQVPGALCDHVARRSRRSPLTLKALNHAWHVLRYLRRHRNFEKLVPTM